MPQGFAKLDGLLRLSQSEGVDIRQSLLRVLTDLYVQAASQPREKEQQFVELAMRLIPEVDSKTRLVVAQKLRSYSLTPPVLLNLLANEIDQIARTPTASPVPQMQGSPETPAITQTVERKEWPELPAYRSGTSTSASVRPGTDALAVGELFLRADSSMRQELLTTLDNQRAARSALPPSIPAGTIDRLEAAALARDPGAFARHLQQGLGISGRLATRIVEDEFGDCLLLVAKVMSVPPRIVARIVMFLNPLIGESVTHFYRLINAYEDISLNAAQQVVASWREAASGTATSRYQPLYAPDSETGSATARAGVRGTAAAATPIRDRGADTRTGQRQGKT
jgi:hypothetical protein